MRPPHKPEVDVKTYPVITGDTDMTIKTKIYFAVPLLLSLGLAGPAHAIDNQQARQIGFKSLYRRRNAVELPFRSEQ